MSIADFIAVLSLCLTCFQLGYTLEKIHEKNSRPDLVS